MTTPSTIRALVVDDDLHMMRLLERALKQGLPEEVHVTGCVDAKAARHCLESEIVDLLVTDLEMPGIDGLQLLRCAKRRNAWTQVILVTGHTRLDALTDAMEMGASDYLLKPLDIRELKGVIDGVLSRLFRWRRALAGTLTAAHA